MKNWFKRNKKVTLNDYDRMLLEEAMRLLSAKRGSTLAGANLYRMVYKCSGSEALNAAKEIIN